MYELSFTLMGILILVQEITRSLPVYTFLGTLRSNQEINSETNYNLICAYEAHQVRPVMEISTITTKEKVRMWTVDPAKKPFAEKSEWEELDRELVLEDSLLMSCVSEKHVANICSWTNEETNANLNAKTIKKIANKHPQKFV
ncbi:hypothetical protein METBIDRAFT_29920 [Metschnikowia bicuspidata var. bicuspidata NRRL YB-4993]|uniref:Uncharacterized protein n=1 Tax=Metschnikowia bicuspidata var. bicuspidata NRRL YB-4993 TaxID=869754 RepID=A0A1A0HHH8_9ASCO|nr:hypothetical protein METBIDRAFT_29920 [Metschnikowia bicuspidata var. bicuspidata NRRL YB-4993]OBA23461.1 hypothetical protein METBIDRAFT_29920 [Metschnikowia bicuspidata var. bicuspidata NRRL YB-4993]